MKFSSGQMLVILLTIIGYFPLWLCRVLGRCAGFFLWLIPNRSLSTTRANIAHCFPELSPTEQKKLVFNSLQHTGMAIFEAAVIWHQPYSWLEPYLVHIKNKQLLDKAHNSGKGLIILLPHIGNWEIFSRYMPTTCDPVALYEAPRIAELGKLIKKNREKTGAKVVPTTSRGVAALLKHLRQGGTTCILPDQVPNNKKRGGVFVPFFGHPVYTMTLVTQLYQRTQSTIIGATAKRIRGGFEVAFHSVGDDIYSSDEIKSTGALNTFVEECARTMPEQYQWEYKRFKYKPK